MDMCVRHKLYTYGTDAEYMNIIWFVDQCEPKDENIRCVAHDILLHSDQDQLDQIDQVAKEEYIMFLLANECVTVTYKLEADEVIDCPDYRMYRRIQKELEKWGE